MKLSAHVVALCLGCFALRGAAVSVRANVRGLQHHAGDGSPNALSDDKPEEDSSGVAASSNVSSAKDAAPGGGHGKGPSVVVPSDLAALLNDAKGGRVDPKKFKATSSSLSVVGDLLKQVSKANAESQKSLYTAVAQIDKCVFPKLPKWNEEKGWKWSFLQMTANATLEQAGPHEALNVHRKCTMQERVIRQSVVSCYRQQRATLIARNYACKVDRKDVPELDACNPNEAEEYGAWSKRMNVYYDEMLKKVVAKRKECGKQNRILSILSAGSFRVGSCKYKDRKLRIKVKECHMKRVQAKAATCRLVSQAEGRCHMYKTCFEEKRKAYFTTQKAADEEVAAQKLQWQLLSRAKCLSDAMDGSSGKVSEAKMDKCIDKVSYNVSHLNLTYPSLPRELPCRVSSKLLKTAGHCSAAKAMTMYVHSNFRGARRDVFSNLAKVGRRWNDRLSSLVVYPQKCVNLYQHSGYRGAQWRYCAGTKKRSIRWVGRGRNDRVSSIRIEDSKLAATFYTGRRFGGSYKQVYRSTRFVGSAWNDKFQSLVVFPRRCVIVYEHGNYRGYRKRWCAGGRSLRISNLPGRLRRRASSIQVQGNRNLVATAYDYENLNGKSFDIYRDYQSLRGFWNNRISSVVVSPRQCLYVYDGSGFRPTMMTYCAGSRAKKVLSFPSSLNNRISSFRVKGSRSAAMVYDKPNYGGHFLNVLGDRSYVGRFWNDRISSLVVFPHKCIVLYQHTGYRGAAWRYCGAGSERRVSYVGGSVSDKASSIRVEGSRLAATIYEHGSFGGRYRPVYGSTGWIGRWWNDKVSSLTVYPGYCVTLYQHGRYRGRAWRYCAGSSERKISWVGRGANDKMSSLRVQRR